MKNKPYPQWNNDVEAARQIHKKHGKSYYFATRWLPKKSREATHVLYAWLRIPDDWVDDIELSPETKKELLRDWRTRWQDAPKTSAATHPILRAAAWVFNEYRFPDSWSHAFLSAMEQDITQDEYETYDDLVHYMHGSAGVVGQMMSKIIGCDPRALPYAELNGYAMQLTNFLRDVGEDYQSRNRIYLPKEDRLRYGVTEKDLTTGSEALTELLKEYIEKTRALYKSAEPGIEYVAKPGRFPFRLASTLYGAILGKIEKNDYDVITKRAHTTTTEKIALAIKQI